MHTTPIHINNKVASLVYFIKATPVLLIAIQFILILFSLSLLPFLMHFGGDGNIYLSSKYNLPFQLILFIGLPLITLICITYVILSFVFNRYLFKNKRLPFYINEVNKNTKLGKLIKLIIIGNFFIIGQILACIIVLDSVQYMALNITGSRSYPSCSSCYKYNWDLNLQIATYSLYIVVFIVMAYILSRLINKEVANARKNKLLLSLFIMSFPTVTLWPVSLFDGPHIIQPVITPVIMSNQPVFIAISSFLAFKIAQLYLHKFKITHNKALKRNSAKNAAPLS